MYDPTLGRFLSRDPIGYDGGSQNLYGYVQDNPLSAIDPSGLKEVKTQADLNANFATKKCLTIFVLGNENWFPEVVNQQIRHFAEHIDPGFSPTNAFLVTGWGPRKSAVPGLDLLTIPSVSKGYGMDSLPPSLTVNLGDHKRYKGKDGSDFSPLLLVIEDTIKKARETMACQCGGGTATFRFIAEPAVLLDLLADKNLNARKMIDGLGADGVRIPIKDLFLEKEDKPSKKGILPFAYVRDYPVHL